MVHPARCGMLYAPAALAQALICQALCNHRQQAFTALVYKCGGCIWLSEGRRRTRVCCAVRLRRVTNVGWGGSVRGMSRRREGRLSAERTNHHRSRGAGEKNRVRGDIGTGKETWNWQAGAGAQGAGVCVADRRAVGWYQRLASREEQHQREQGAACREWQRAVECATSTGSRQAASGRQE